MAFRGAAELESTVMARAYHITNNVVTGEDADKRLQAIAEVALLSILLDLTGSNMIPTSCITRAVNEWAKDMVALAEITIKLNEFPQTQINVRKMTEKIFENHRPGRVALSPFVRLAAGSSSSRFTLQDDELRLELERRGLEETILEPPPRTIQTEGRARIAAAVQQSLVEVEAQRQRQQEEQRQKDREEKELEETGFGRKVELD